MSISAGTRLEQYEVRSQIGAGGMGEVYLARDTKLKRDVALKVLPEQFVRDSDRLMRFRREAELLASLNHTNIAQIYGLEESGRQPCLVIEYVPGETLHERIQREGPVPLDDALEITRQICEALEHAHEKGVIHRDLKPANIKLTPEGKVKVLDFGLAKAFAGDGTAATDASPIAGNFDSQSPTLTALPTLTASPTIPGAILGTAAYMSPEQARGKPVDKRTDIWSLGCVLYEVLTGRPAFAGEDASDILANVLKTEPDWSLLPAATPAYLRGMLRRCLRKDAAKRFRAVADVLLYIEDAVEMATYPAAAHSSTSAQQTTWRRGIPWVSALVISLVVGISAWNLRSGASPDSVPSRLTIPLPPHEPADIGVPCPQVRLSPDGSYIAYAIGSGPRSQLHLRRMDRFESRLIPGIRSYVHSPFFSPDGRWLAFYEAGELKKVATSGGTPISLAKTELCGAIWTDDDSIIFGSFEGLKKISASGGTPEMLIKVDSSKGEEILADPELLPRNQSILFTAKVSSISDATQVVAQRLDTGERKVLIPDGNGARYLPTGHLIYYQTGNLFAAAFDPERLEFMGAPVPVIEGVGETLLGGGIRGTGQFDVSDRGTLIYLPAANSESPGRTLSWVDRKGTFQVLPAPPRPYDDPSLSPNGQRIAVELDADVWVYDIPRNTLTRLTFDGNSGYPLWTPDGKRVVYQSAKNGPPNLYWKSADGSGSEQRLATSENEQVPTSWSPNGDTLVFHELKTNDAGNILFLAMSEQRRTQPLVHTSYREGSAILSPDGRWLAYLSNNSGRYEVYVQPFPGPGGQRQVSTGGGVEPKWSASGRELFFRSGNKVMVVDVTTTPTFTAGNPRALFEARFISGTKTFEVAPDGQHFLIITPADQESSPTQINVVLNWFEELKQKVPSN